MIEQLQISEKRNIQKYSSSFGQISYSEPQTNSKVPFIVILHSLGKNENQAIKFANLLPKNAFVLSVRAPIEWRVDGDESFAWFDIKGPMIDNFCQESDVLKSISHLIDVIDECRQKFDNLDDPIILGFSQGGIVGLTMAVEKYYKIKGVYCHCGYYERKLSRDVKEIQTHILMTNGVNDNIIPRIWVEESYEILRKKCNSFESYFIDCGHEINHQVVFAIQDWIYKII